MKKQIFGILLAALLLLCACVPTPEEEFVIGKDNEAMIEKAKETAEPVPSGSDLYDMLGCPETYVFDLKDEATRVIVCGEAQMVLPDADGLPLAYVQAARFSQEQVYAFFRTLTAGKKMYDLPNDTPKWAIEKQIKETQARVDELLAKGKDDSDSEVSALRNLIRSMQKNYLNAPDDVELIPNDGTLQSFEMSFMGKFRGTGSGTHSVSAPFEEKSSAFGVNNDADYADGGSYYFTDEDGNEAAFIPQSGSNLYYMRERSVLIGTYAGCTLLLDVTNESKTGDALQFPDDLIVPGHQTPETLLLSVTPAEAREQAEALIRQCGAENMAVDGVYLMTDRQTLHVDEENKAELQDFLEEQRALLEHQAYVVRFLRQVEGTPVESNNGVSQAMTDDSGYGPEWSYETLEVSVDDEGIQTVYWEGPLEIESIITEQASLLPFSQIAEIMQKMLPVVYANYGGEENWQIEVEEVRLCLWRIFDRNSYTRGILTPVWCLYGTMNGYRDRLFQPILILNAVDGSIIDSRKGY